MGDPQVFACWLGCYLELDNRKSFIITYVNLDTSDQTGTSTKLEQNSLIQTLQKSRI